jgi:hypothetical protein
MDGMDVVDRMDVTQRLSLFGVHVVHKVHARRVNNLRALL